MPHLLFIVESIPDDLLLKKLGISFFKSKGCRVNILYIAAVSRKKYYLNIKTKKSKNYYDGKNKLKIINYLDKNILKNTIVFSDYRQNSNTIFIYDYLKQRKTKLALISRESILQKKKNVKDIINILFKSPRLFIKLLLKKILYIDNKELKYDFIFTSGKLQELKFRKKSKIIKIHHYDYDFYLNTKKFEIKKKYILFLSPATLNPDTYDNNPGYKVKNIPNFKNKKYFKNIKKFLNSLKNISKIDILIAKHPKDNFNLEKKINYKCYKDKTPELVKNSELVVCFDSSAFQFAILWKKPIIFLTSNNFPELVREDIMTRCSFFNKTPINIDFNFKKADFYSNLKINRNDYKKYKYLYISNSKKKNKSSSEIIFNFIKNI